MRFMTEQYEHTQRGLELRLFLFSILLRLLADDAVIRLISTGTRDHYWMSSSLRL